MLHEPNGVSRRVFLGAAAGLATVIHRPLFAQPAAPSDQIQLALIGVGGMGTGRLREFMTHPDVRIAAICDVDSRHRDAAIALVQSTLGYAPAGEGDFRRLLTNKDIDAVAIQTPIWLTCPRWMSASMLRRPARRFSPLVSIVCFITCGLSAR